MRSGDLLTCTLHEVCEAGGGVGSNTRYWVVQSFDNLWQDRLMEVLLELVGHVVRDLADAVAGGVSDLRIGVLQMLDDHGHHDSDLLRLVDVLTNLGEGHDTSVLISPVTVVRDGVLNKGSNKRQHDFFTDR